MILGWFISPLLGSSTGIFFYLFGLLCFSSIVFFHTICGLRPGKTRAGTQQQLEKRNHAKYKKINKNLLCIFFTILLGKVRGPFRYFFLLFRATFGLRIFFFGPFCSRLSWSHLDFDLQEVIFGKFGRPNPENKKRYFHCFFGRGQSWVPGLSECLFYLGKRGHSEISGVPRSPGRTWNAGRTGHPRNSGLSGHSRTFGISMLSAKNGTFKNIGAQVRRVLRQS